MNQKKMNLFQLLAMSFGFFGIQHGFSIQFAKMSVIYEKLGAAPDQIPFLWLAAPLTGLFVQPLIGYLSDRTWIKYLGRRRPYFLAGSILAAIALFFLPNATSIWMAAAFLWVLDASINISMQPFRAFVADKLPGEQVADGYAMQTLMIGLGGTAGFVISSTDWLKLIPSLSAWAPSSLHFQFYMCGLIYLGSVLLTVLTTPEDPPKALEGKNPDSLDLVTPVSESSSSSSSSAAPSLKGWVTETVDCMKTMPSAMKHLAVIQLFTWTGLFCMLIFYSVAIAHYVYGGTDPGSQKYDQGVAAAASAMSVYQIVSTVFALVLPGLARKFGKVGIYTTGLAFAAIGLVAICFVRDPFWLWLPMVAVGIGWATILSMPYAILVDHIPTDRYGMYMGLFNMFIVLPEIACSVGLGWLMQNVFQNNQMMAIATGGACMLVAAVLSRSLRKFEPPATTDSEEGTQQLPSNPLSTTESPRGEPALSS